MFSRNTVSPLSIPMENINHETDGEILKRVVEENRKLKEEIQSIKHVLKENIILTRPEVGQLNLKIDSLNERVQNHHYAKQIRALQDIIIPELEYHYESLLPLSSGRYKPDQLLGPGLKLGGEGLHLGEQTLHFLQHIASSTSKLVTITQSLTIFIPFSGLATELIELWHDHQTIHQAQHQLSALSRRTTHQDRVSIYNYIVLNTLLTLHEIFFQGDSENTQQIENISRLVLAVCVSSLGTIEPSKNAADLDKLPTIWFNTIVNKFKQQGKIMNKNHPHAQEVVYSCQKVSVAVAIQQLFLQEDDKSSYGQDNHRLKLPAIKDNDFCHDFHRDLYHRVLKPYNERVTSHVFFAHCCFYSKSELLTLKKYQSRFNHALKLIDKDLRPLKSTNPSHYELQLSLINTCLYGNLLGMIKDMKWHHEAIRFHLHAAGAFKLCAEPTPLTISSDAKTVTFLSDNRVEMAIARAEKAEAQILEERKLRERAEMQAEKSDMRAEASDMRAEASDMRAEASDMRAIEAHKLTEKANQLTAIANQQTHKAAEAFAALLEKAKHVDKPVEITREKSELNSESNPESSRAHGGLGLFH